MSVKQKGFIAFMVCSLLTFSPSVEAHQKSSRGQRNLPKEQKVSPSYGGTLVWGVVHKPTIINPILTTHSISMGLLDLLFNRLVKINSKGEIEPDLARKWEISEDGLVYTFYLQEDVKFHDGVAFTAEDVLFTYQQHINIGNKSPFRSHFELVDSLQVINEFTFQIVLKTPVHSFLYKLVREIIPKHILEGKDLYKASFNKHPIGTGPFQFKSWDTETDQMELEANLKYFEGRPYLDRIIVKTFSDVTQLWTALMRREVDLVQYINYEDYEVIKDDPAFKAYAINWGMYYALVYNLDDSILRDIEVRRAIASGVDVQSLINEMEEVEGVFSTGPFHPDSVGFNPDVRPILYNPVKAKMTLMHRGWKDIDGDGILEKDRRKLEIRLLVDERSAIYMKITSILRQQLSEIGIKLTVLLYKDEKELTPAYLDRCKPQAWLRFFVGKSFDQFDSYYSINDWYSSSSQSGRLWRYKNKKVDLFFEFARETQDQNEKTNLYKEIHQMIYEDQPACFLFFPRIFCALSSKFQDTEEYFNKHMPAYVMKDWYVSEN